MIGLLGIRRDLISLVIEAIDRKVQYMQYYRRNFDNVEMAAL